MLRVASMLERVAELRAVEERFAETGVVVVVGVDMALAVLRSSSCIAMSLWVVGGTKVVVIVVEAADS